MYIYNTTYVSNFQAKEVVNVYEGLLIACVDRTISAVIFVCK